MTISVTGTYTVPAGAVLDFAYPADQSLSGGAYDLQSSAQLNILGSVTFEYTSYAYSAAPIQSDGINTALHIGVGGSVTLSASGGSDGFFAINNPASFSNDGTLTVSSPGGAFGAELRGGGTFSNTGTITVTQTSGLSTGVLCGDNAGEVTTVLNTGTITAGTTVLSSYGAVLLTNSGTLNGGVEFLGVGNQIHNTGAIHGLVQFMGSSGQDLYDGRGGTQTGGIQFSGSSGVDTVYLGNDGETVTGGGGTLIATGGTGSDTIKGGSANDRLAGLGGSDTYTGGGGSDTFVLGPGVGAAVITDFAPGSGDAIDLSQFGTFHSLSDVLAAATQVGANTVISLGSGSVTLDNVLKGNLTAGDFDFIPTVNFSGDVATVEAGSMVSVTWGPVGQFLASGGTLVNNGSMILNGSAAAVGISTSLSGAFQNLADATFSVTSSSASASGVSLQNGGEFDNSGAFTVSAATSATGLTIGTSTITSVVNNSGTITVTGSSSIGVSASATGGLAVNLTNSGTITAQTAVQYFTTGSITNSGQINGAVVLSSNDQLTNTGTINGAVSLGAVDTLNSQNGTITGTVTLSSGSNSVTLGAENDTVAFGPAGTHVVDGGGGTNTASYASAATGVTVSLAAQGQAQNTGAGTDTLYNFQALIGSAYNDTLTAANGTSTLTGGAGADTFQIQSSADNTTITDFSDAQGDRIVLSNVPGLTTWANILAHAQQVNQNTVVNLGSGTLTLDNIQLNTLTAADFSVPNVYSPIDVYGALAIAAGQNLTFTGSNAGYGAYALHPPAALDVYGTVTLQDNIANDTLDGVVAEGTTGNPVFWIETGGTVTIGATGSGDTVYGYYSQGDNADFENDGTFSVSSAGAAYGVTLRVGGVFLNTGAMTVAGQGAFTYGVSDAGAILASNSGSFSVSGLSRVDGFDFAGAGSFANSGMITVTSSGGATYGVLAGDSAGSLFTIKNSGTITAQYAVNSIAGSGPMSVINSGVLNGSVVLGTAAGNGLDNTGVIHGAVSFDGVSGQQLYVGIGGELSGTLAFASGSGVTGTDIAYLGNDGETVQGGSALMYVFGGSGADHITGGSGIAVIDGGGGNDVLDGGSSGLSSVAFASAKNGVTVSLALQGQAQNTGDGIDTLTHFAGLIGSTFDDHLTGDANNNVIDGGGGNDVLDGGGGFNVVSFSTATSGVTVSLTLQGQAQNTGVGTDILTNFQGLAGSAYNDTLEGGGGPPPTYTYLTGGGGADTFVYRPSDASVAIEDFSDAQGDRIDLVGITGIQTLSDVLAHAVQSGSDTVLSFGTGFLRLVGISMSSLTAADFGLAGTTGPGVSPNAGETLNGTAGTDWLQGGPGNDILHGGGGSDFLDGGAGLNTATYDGVRQQYTVANGGSPMTVSGGPEVASDDLTNIQRIQFTDGYLAVSPTDTAGQVYRLYEATLNRAPDQEGLTNWVNSLNNGTSLQTVANGFVGSQEFQNDYGSLSNSDFVTLLYENVLHRAPDAPGLANWVSYLTSGQDTRAQVVLGFSESQEDIADFTPAVQQGLWVGNPDAAEVARLYDAVLGREPDAAGLANWTNMMESGTSLQTVANGFVGSQEFQTVYGALTNTAFVTLLYQNVLHRAPDATGLNNWVTDLVSGAMSRAQVVVGFSESPEHITNLAPHIDSGIWVAG